MIFISDSQSCGVFNSILKPASPIPGCSKNLDNDLTSSNLDSQGIDNSMQEDAMCIQEIIPWATLDQIYSCLKTHSNSTTRKEQTLWDLMSEKKTSGDSGIESNKRSIPDLPQKNKKLKLENIDKKHKTDDFKSSVEDLDEVIPLNFFDDPWDLDLPVQKSNFRNSAKASCSSNNNRGPKDSVIIDNTFSNRFSNNMEVIDVDLSEEHPTAQAGNIFFNVLYHFLSYI